MKKKLLAILLTVCMVLSMAPAALAADSVFTDVNTGDWFAEEVKYVYDNGLMYGVGDNTFDPSGTVTRAMVWTTLARLDGVDTTGSDPWWLAGQQWAMENEISDGTMATENITREQLVTMIWRYAKYIDMDVSEGEDTNILSYTDALDVNEWAISAMQWACAVGIINGIDGALQPQGDASRAMLAAILYRFVEEVMPGEEEPEPSTPVVPSYPSYPVIPPHSHTYGDWAPNYDGTHTRSYNCGHSGSEKANCTLVAGVCSVCGYDENAIYIDTAAEFKAFAADVNSGTFSGGTVVLTANITLTEAWEPIGTAENAFTGTFDGNGKTISNLKIESGDFTGLFGYVSDATIKNVVLEDALVSGGERVGALIGKITGDAVISDCSVVGDSNVTGNDSNTGGLIGEIVNGEVELTNLVNNAAVENTKTSNSRAGGIVGQVTTNANVTITNCTNNGAVKTAGGYAGGIVSAYQSGTLTIDNCVNNGTLDGAYEGNMLGWYTTVRSITISADDNVFDVNAIGCVDITISSTMSLYGKNYFVNKKAELAGVDDAKQTFGEIFAEGEIGTSPKELWDKLIGFYAYAKSKNSAFADSPETYWEMFDISVIGYSEPDWNSYFEGYNAQCEEANKVEKTDFADTSWREKIVYLAPQHEEHIYKYNSNGDGTHNGLCACGVTVDDLACVFTGDTCVDCGYESDNYIVDSADQFMALVEDINDGGDYSGKVITLTSDIDLTGKTWTPIGSSAEHAFSGTFDGNGKKISNLSITTGDFAGLFGYVSDATIENVVLVNAQVSGGERVGALVGQIVGDATVSDCSVDETSTVTGSDSNTGGLIGEIITGTVQCTNLVNNAAVENTKSSNSRAGGIVGQVTTNANVTLTDCTNNGAVKTADGYAGGIVSAYQSGTLTIDNCVNNGELDGEYEGNMLGWYTTVRGITISADDNVFDVNAIGCIDITISSNMSLYGKSYFVNKRAELTGVDNTKQTFSEIFAEGEIGTSPKELWDKLIGFYAVAKSTNSAFADSPETYWGMFDISVIGYTAPDYDQYLNAYNAQCGEGKQLSASDFTDASWREKIVYLAP